MKTNLSTFPKWRKSSWHTKYEQRILRWKENFAKELEQFVESANPELFEGEINLAKEILGQ